MLEKKVDELCRIYHDARVKARGGGGVGGVSGGANSGNNTPNNNNESSSPNNMQKTTAGAHNAWGGFIRFVKLMENKNIVLINCLSFC